MSRLVRLGTVAMLPSKAVEEAAHAAAAWPWADELALVVRPGDGHAGLRASVDEDTPDWGWWLIHHAPKIAGVVLAVMALWAVASGARPSNPLEVAGSIACAGWWAKLVAPEARADHAEGGGDGG